MFTDINEEDLEVYCNALDNLITLKKLYDKGYDVSCINFLIDIYNSPDDYDVYINDILTLIMGEYYSIDFNEDTMETIFIWNDPLIIDIIKKGQEEKLYKYTDELANRIYADDVDITCDERGIVMTMKDYPIIPVNSDIVETIMSIADYCKGVPENVNN